MITSEVVAYTKAQIQQQIPITDIETALRQVGWTHGDATAIIQTAQGQAAAPSVTTNWVFRFGFASIFLINAFIAVFYPNDFLKLVSDNFLVIATGHDIWYVWFAGLNDLLLGMLILSNKWPRIILTWASLWLFVVTLAKVIHLL